MFWQFSKHNPTYSTNIKNERGNPVFFGHSNKDEEHVLLHLTGTLQTALGLSNVEFLFSNKGNNKITELRTILQRESQNS
jgi:hypothetical protein